jgi:hypothetical protein
MLMVIVSWSFRADNVVAGSFRLEDIQICDELDDNKMPLNAGRVFPGGAKQVCLWFKYLSAREGDSLEIFWKYGNRVIQRDSYRLSEQRGTRAFYLLKEDGSPLPSGSYTVVILCNRRERGVERFSVEAASEDAYLGDEESMD